MSITDQILHPTKEAETILVAEDDAAVRMLVGRILQMQGYAILQAQDGLEALQMAKMHTGRIDLLLTDIDMPNMNGEDLIDHIFEDRPNIKILLMSTRRIDTIKYTLRSNISFLPKPFSQENLVCEIQGMLNV